MRVGHRRDVVADDPKIATCSFELDQFIAREEAPGVCLHCLEHGDDHPLAFEFEMLHGRRCDHFAHDEFLQHIEKFPLGRGNAHAPVQERRGKFRDLDELHRSQEMMDQAADEALARSAAAKQAIDHLGEDIVLALARVLCLQRIEKRRTPVLQGGGEGILGDEIERDRIFEVMTP